MATPVYPDAIKTFGSDVVDNVTTVYAAHINELRAEVGALETALGAPGLKSSVWTETFTTNTPVWASLVRRLANIEAGVVGDAHTQYVKRDGSAGMTNALNMGGNQVRNVAAGTADTDAVTFKQISDVNANANGRVSKAGDTMTGNLNMGGRYLLNVGQSGAPGDAATVGQVNAASAAATAANANANTRIPMNGDAVVSNFIIKANPIQFMDSSGVVRYTVDQMSDSLGVNTRDANGWRSIPFTIKYADGVVRAHYAMEVGGTLTVSGGATFINGVTVHGAGLYVGGEFAKYVDGTLRFHMHNGGTSVYSDLAVTGSLISEGQMRLSDAGRPEETFLGYDPDRRWLLYRGDAVVRRMSDASFRFMIAAIASGSSQVQKSDIAAPSDTPDILGLQPRSFQWTDSDEMKADAYPGVRYGLIAEEVAAVDERFVMRGQDGDVVGLDQHALTAALIAKVTELEQRLDVLEGS